MDNTQLLSENTDQPEDEDEQYREIDPEFLIRSTNSGSAGPTNPSRNAVGITWYKATFLIVNAALGAGILNFPYAFDETGGIIAGNLAHVIFFSFAMGSLIILSICAKEKDSKTYQEVVCEFCGPKWGHICSLCITLYCFVTCITFIIIIGDQFDRAFASFIGPHFCYHWYFNRKFTMVISSLLLIIPSCLKRIDGMEIMSYIGVASVMYLMIVVIIEMAIGDYPHGAVDVWDVNFFKFFNVVPTISFGYQCHVSSVPILSCLKKRETSTVLKACFAAMFVCFFVYTVSANCGYITFGSIVSADVLLDYDATQVYVLIAVLLLALKSWTTYPILLFCVREAVSDLYIGIRSLDYLEAAQSEPKRRKIIATLLWIATIILAVFIPGLNTVIRLLGSLAAVFILIFPGMCFLNLTMDQHSGEVGYNVQGVAKMLVACAYVALGAFTLGLAFTLGVESIFRIEAENPICIPPTDPFDLI